MIRQATGALGFDTTREGLVEITDDVRDWTLAQGVSKGLLTLFCRHTSASLLIQENAARGSVSIWSAISRGSRLKTRLPTRMTMKGQTICRRICERR